MHLAAIEPQRRSSVFCSFGRCSVYAAWLLAIALSGVSLPTRASEACTVLLCLAGNWRSIDQCVPPVRRLLRNLVLGRSFPICAFASVPNLNVASLPSSYNATGTANVPSDVTPPAPTPTAGTQATLRWADETFCPVQYRTVVEDERFSNIVCSFAGAIEVTLGGQLWNRTWWNLSGDVVTEWTAAARSAVPQAAADDRFDRDYEAWLEVQRRTAELQQQQTRADMGDGE
jgi:hypothetical protein